MLFLDIDGPINPEWDHLDEVPHELDMWGDFKNYDLTIQTGPGLAMGLRLWLSRKMATSVYNAAGGNITWLSSWCDYDYVPAWELQDGARLVCQANRYVAPLLGWEALPYLSYHVPINDDDHLWWKMRRMKELAKDNNLPDKWVWVDDDFHKVANSLRWCSDNGGLAIPVESNLGLSPEQIDQIDEFLCS